MSSMDSHSTAKKRVRKSKKELFLDSFAEDANVMSAARAAGIHRSTVYVWLEHDSDFSAAFNLAKETAKDVVKAEIKRRAIDGWKEEVYQLGHYAGTVRKYSDTLLIFHAKMLMPEYRDKQHIDLNTSTNAQDMQAIHTAIAKALGPYPDAKIALANALEELENRSGK